MRRETSLHFTSISKITAQLKFKCRRPSKAIPRSFIEPMSDRKRQRTSDEYHHEESKNETGEIQEKPFAFLAVRVLPCLTMHYHLNFSLTCLAFSLAFLPCLFALPCSRSCARQNTWARILSVTPSAQRFSEHAMATATSTFTPQTGGATSSTHRCSTRRLSAAWSWNTSRSRERSRRASRTTSRTTSRDPMLWQPKNESLWNRLLTKV